MFDSLFDGDSGMVSADLKDMHHGEVLVDESKSEEKA